MIDINQTYNPYDFANPVNDSDLFIGREKEMEEIRYYLNHAKDSPRPINLAILGHRASGKTSVLNMCEEEAKNRGFCTVRIDLDESDADTQLGFFSKIFDGAFSSACDFNAFGGKNGKTYDTYLDMVNSYLVPDDKTWCPFLFPIQLAKAMGSGNCSVPLSDYNFKRDIAKIQAEINIPIIVLFDECNVLSKNRVLLEKLRNIFMNTQGYMLIFTGTPDLFPAIDEIFSPIIRQFKKINIDIFENEDETKDCIRKPLEKANINPDDVFNFNNYQKIEDIHNLAGRRPYEVQLICHILFRRIQQKRAQIMELNLSVLEELRKELETSQDVTTRPILQKVLRLNKSKFKALELVCISDKRENFDQVWAREYIFNGNRNWDKDTLHDQLQYFLKQDILEIVNDKIRFPGDDFDKIYTKYLAHEHKVRLFFINLPIDFEWFIRLNSFVLNRHKFLEKTHIFPFSGEEYKIKNVISKLHSKCSNKDVFSETPTIIIDVYKIMILYRHNKMLPIIEFMLNSAWFKFNAIFYSKTNENLESMYRIDSKFQQLIERASEVSVDISIEKAEYPVVPTNDLIELVEKTANEKVKRIIALFHYEQTSTQYLKNKNLREAVFHANLCYKYLSEFDIASVCNNLGYLYISIDELDKAQVLIPKAVELAKSPAASA